MKSKTRPKLKTSKHLIALVVGSVITIIAYFWFINSAYFDQFNTWTEENFLIFYSSLVLIKTAGIVWPPIPGGLLTFGAIPIIGWLPAYSADFLGSMIGSTIAFFLAKKYGYQFIEKIFDQQLITQIKSIRVKPRREIESVFLFRIFGGTIVEIICYAAGLLRMSYKNFLIGSVASHLLMGMPFYYFFDGILLKKNYFLSAILIIIAAVIFFKCKDRYFDRRSE